MTSTDDSYQYTGSTQEYSDGEGLLLTRFLAAKNVQGIVSMISSFE